MGDDDALKLLFHVSNSHTLENSLDILIQTAKSDSGRSKRILPALLTILQSQTLLIDYNILSLCFKLLRNLCAGELVNQNLFLEFHGVLIVVSRLEDGSDPMLVRWGLQVLANVCLAGKQHQRAIWEELFPFGFVSLARLGSKEVCDPLCMVIYTCCDGNPEWFGELCSDTGWPVVVELVRTASSASFGEDWIKLILSRICLEESQLPELFSKLRLKDIHEGEDGDSKDDQFSSEQAFLLQILSEILNERIEDVTVSKDVALFVYGIFKKYMGVLEHSVRGKSGLPTGITAVDVLGYSLTILRDICANDSARCKAEDANDVVDVLLSNGLIELLLIVLGDLEPPAIIRKGIKQSENQDGASSSSKPCPYKGFRRDIVALVGNCVYKRKHAQDELRNRNGVLLLLQQCVTDEDNPFLREWGIWSVRNMLEGNEENQKVVSELQLQGSADMPEISALGLRVENAEDNHYNEGVKPRLEFVITSDDITDTGAPATLLIFNNEKGFSPKNIESICSVGRSTKKGNRSSGYIGEKGIGFKSVFLVTAQPDIFSNEYQIRFNEKPCPHCSLGYIVPEWVEEKPTLADIKKIYGQDILPATTIVLPLKSDKVNPVKQQLSNVHPEVLLFLTKIRQLSVKEVNENPTQNTVTAVSISSEVDFMTRKNMNAESYTLHLSAEENSDDEMEWFDEWELFHASLVDPEGDQNQKVDHRRLHSADEEEERVCLQGTPTIKSVGAEIRKSISWV
ncbi:uncharacterized protein LOC131616180 isoform X2 [Vicia villosa]|uniref:uncharacterized protein LOC131616180 isoform X2 n=1 Tax=Vicia villosa TaxID=3911 RepID=UPI00273BE563|nr:uncharacterized protein LOC131616180 isoform X2 [Vicia villosa]